MEIYHNIINELIPFYPENEARSIAQLLLEKVTGFNLHKLIITKKVTLSNEQTQIMKHYLEQLKLQKPIQYILGEAYFFDLTFKVTPNVLIPRPETEELVEWIIETCAGKENLRLLDIGTGSGCIAVSLAKNLKGSSVYAIDISKEALEVAQENSRINGANVTFSAFDFLKDDVTNILGSPFDIIISNPPYVRESEKELMQPNVLEYEPPTALFVPNNNPLIFYHAIAEKAPSILKQNGLIFCEINEYLGNETATLFRNFGFNFVVVKKDIHGKARMIKASRE